MSGQTIISIISTNLSPFSANSGKTVGQSSSIRWYPSILQNRIVFLEIRDLENLLFSTAYLKPRICSFLCTTSFRSTQWPSGRVVKSVLVKIILIPRIEMIEGSDPIYPMSFLRFSKTFLGISMDIIYNCNRLDFDSDYSFITNK